MLKKQLHVYLILMLFSMTSCLNLISRIPKGIDPNPLFSLNLDSNLNVISMLSANDSALSRKCKCDIIHTMDLSKQEWGHFLDRINIPSTNDTIKNINRGIELWQFRTREEALNQYLDYRKTFKSSVSARIYRERKAEDNRYFIIYKTIRLDYNHGLPYAINNDSELMLGFLVSKYFISISYTKSAIGTSKKPEYYIEDLNNDILEVSKILNDLN